MASRHLPCISAMFRVAASSVFLPLLLVTGLLASPVTCQCGSTLPHDHSLFALGKHTHEPGAQASREHTHVESRERDSTVESNSAVEARVDGPALRAASDFSSGQSRALCLLLSSFDDETAKNVAGHTAVPAANGCPVLPDPPPPRA